MAFLDGYNSVNTYGKYEYNDLNKVEEGKKYI